MREAVSLCGAMVFALALLVFVSVGVPRIVHAWYIYIYPITYTPVNVGGNTTISWQAPTADFCDISGTTIPCTTTTYTFGVPPYARTFSVTSCVQRYNGQYGSLTTGPVNGPSTYTFYCENVDAGAGGGNGSNTLTINPTPTNSTLSGFTANPTSVAGNGRSTLSWTGTKGSKFSSCQLTGGQWGTAGAFFTALPGSIQTDPLVANTTYSFRCIDTDGASTPTRTATVTVADACSNIPGSQATVPANGTASGGVCTCNSGYTLSGDQCVGSDVCSNIVGTQLVPPANGTTSGGTCSCNSGYSLSGGSCVASCTGAHQVGTPPSCSCDTGYNMQGGVCVATACPGVNEVNWPTCSCATGYSRDSGTNMCIRQATLSITVNGLTATRVRRGNQVVVTWSASGVTLASCRVTTNTGATVGSTDSGTVTSAVAAQTTYRLSCSNDAGTTVTSQAAVTLIPGFEEPH